MKLIEIAVAASGRLATNSTFFEMAPAGGAATGAAPRAAVTPRVRAPTCRAARTRSGRLMRRTSTWRVRSLPVQRRAGPAGRRHDAPVGIPPVLVTGATGRVGRLVVDLLVDAGVPVRALTHRPEAAATLPAGVEVVTGDLTVPESLDRGLAGGGAVFLVWTPPLASARGVIERLARHPRRVVLLSSPHRTP